VAGALGIGHLVEAVERRPVPLRELRAIDQADLDALLGHASPFLAQRLALAAGEALEEVIEVTIAAIEPVELHLVSRVQAGAGEARGVVGSSGNSTCQLETLQAFVRPAGICSARSVAQSAGRLQVSGHAAGAVPVAGVNGIAAVRSLG
jgi:hypothetical protein